MEHDEKCAQHDEAVKLVRARTHEITNLQTVQIAESERVKEDIAELAGAVEKAVTELHKHDVSYERLESGLRGVAERIPHTLGADLVSLSIGLKVVVTELDAVKSLVRSDLIGRQEFEPIKRLVYGMVGLVLTAVVVALIALVVKR